MIRALFRAACSLVPVLGYWVGKGAGRREVLESMRDEAVTDRQYAYLTRLCRERGVEVPPRENLTRARASLAIDDLKESPNA